MASRRTSPNSTDDNHAHRHAQGTNDQKPLSSESVDRPSCVQGEDDTKSGIQPVDQRDLVRGEEHLVDER